MARKKAIPVEGQEPNLEAQGLPEGEGEFQEGLSAAPSEEGNPPEGAPSEESSPAEGLPEPLEGEGASVGGLPEELGELSSIPEGLPGPIGEEVKGLPSDDTGDGGEIPGVPPDIPPEGSEAAAGSEEANDAGPVPQDAAAPSPEIPEAPEAHAEAETSPAEAPPPKTDRQSFYGLNFNELDRDLTAEERQEWNSIYASYRGRSALTGTIIGVDPHSISVRNKGTGQMERQTMYCAIVIPYRVRVVIGLNFPPTYSLFVVVLEREKPLLPDGVPDNGGFFVEGQLIVRRQVYGDFLPGYLLVFDGQLSGKLPETRGVQDTAHAFQAGEEQPQLLLRQEGCAIIPCDEFSCPQKFTNRDTINWTFRGKNRTMGLEHKEVHYGRINLYESRRLLHP